MAQPIKPPKKLIEVALPLDAINAAAVREKSIRHGHPSTLHLWWARRPLAAARAVIFGQMVNDPSWKWEMDHSEEIPPNNLKASWAASRKRLFSLLEELVKWENSTNEDVLEKAHAEIRKSWQETCELNKDHPQAAELFNPDKLPVFHDPFAGGGALPLEAQRLGLESYASDLNPVAVTINKAMIEIPPKFAGRAPVNPEARVKKDLIDREWKGAEGLAEDVRYYGQWMRAEVQKRIGHLYPSVEITPEMAENRQDLKPLIGKKLTVIAWLWARTVKSPNPAFRHIDVPLIRSVWLCTRDHKKAWVEPIVDVKSSSYHFKIRIDGTPRIEQTVGRKGAVCIMSDTAIPLEYIRSEAKAGRLSERLMAIVADGPDGRLYLPPDLGSEQIAYSASPSAVPSARIDHWAGCTNCVVYGMENFEQLFSRRQLTALTTFSDLLVDVQMQVQRAAIDAGFAGANDPLSKGGNGAQAYAEAVTVLLAFGVDKGADYWSTMCTWHNSGEKIGHTFGRQAIPMSWDYAECNPLSDSSGNWMGSIEWIAKSLETIPAAKGGHAFQHDAALSKDGLVHTVCSTDPPYYDNVPYSNLSDYFYVWLRRNLRTIYPDLFATIDVPRQTELVANQFRHGGKPSALTFFMEGMKLAMSSICHNAHPAVPVTIYYAFKQSDTEESGTTSTGWETFLDAVIQAGFAISGTWPMRTEMGARRMAVGNNALASSIVLVCRPRSTDAITISRRAFQRELNQVLPEALDEMTKGAGGDHSPVAPVDLSQAIIGPGMAVYSKYAAVLEADGTPMSVKTALQLINRFLAEDEFDHDTQFCLHWFEQHGWSEGKFGEADTLARAKGTAVESVKQAGVLFAAGGVVRLLKWSQYPADWDPLTDNRLPVWEALHHLVRVFKTEGETGAGKVFSAVQAKAEAARQLAYRLYTLCERAGWGEDARAYNEIISSWSAIESAAANVPGPQQATLFG